ncbi:MAG TPA: Rieske 2Fe-2S domain-containing protein, partial [Chloroflexota bacterium]
MLTAEENERLTRVEGQAPMGQLVRRFWLPFLLSSDLSGPDCVPVRVRLLGENLVAFRDTSGNVGLLDTLCAHRRADLYYGRNEEDGLRCVYHGWKYDFSGQCVECPTEPADSNFKYTVHLRSYPVVERAGVCWTYMGPRAVAAANSGSSLGSEVPDGGTNTGLPELPEFEWMRVPDGHLFASWSTQDCNFVQAIEGGIDSVHS